MLDFNRAGPQQGEDGPVTPPTSKDWGQPAPESPPWEDIQLADKPYAKVPQEMMGVRQWVCWKAVEVPGKPKPTEVPIDALTSHQAKVNDPKTWCGLNDAENYFDEWKDAEHVHVDGKTGAEVEGKIMGVGFVFSATDDYCGIDLDNCVNDSGTIEPWAADIVQKINSYTEISPSGTGLHIIAKGAIPSGFNKGNVEGYDRGRYFTFTGDIYEGRQFINCRPEQVEQFYKRYSGKADQPDRAISICGTVDPNIVLERALRSKNAEKIRRMLDGELEGQPSASDRDLALCSHLVFFCGKIPNNEKFQVIDQIVRTHPVYRAKWDEVHRPEDRATYGRMTIEKAVGGVKDCYREKTETKTDSRDGKKVLTLDDFTLNGMSQRMKKQMLEDKFVLSRLAILGQMSIFYAGPNTGKTLLTLWMIIEKINAREINGSDVYYINADDTFKGLTYKTHLAEKHGFKMIGVGHKHDDAEERFEPKMLVPILESMIENGTASGVVVVLDTAKKFTDLMDKKTTSEFAAAFREFVSHGGTGIFMAHINKHRDGDDKPVHSGTTDLIDDSDCAYIIDTISEDPATGIKTVRFENKKNRGDVLREESFQYDCRTDTSYNGKLASIKRLDDDNASEVEVMARLSKKFENDREVVEAIKDCIKEGIIQKTALIDEAVKRLGATKPRVKRVLEDYTGRKADRFQFWYMTVEDKNAKTYALNYGMKQKEQMSTVKAAPWAE